jgi:hypothetical protein
MIKKTAVVITVLLAMLSRVGYSQTISKDEMVKKIFTTLQHKDEEGFIKLFPDADTFKNWLASAVNDTSLGSNDKEGPNLMNIVNDSFLQHASRRNFRKYIQQGEKKGVDWTIARLVSYSADTLMTGLYDKTVTSLQGKIYFNVNETEFYLKYRRVIWIDRKGWYAVTIDNLDERSKEDLADDEDLTHLKVIADSLRVADSIAAIESMDKTIQKKQQPVKKKPEKNKTQQPGKLE